MPGDFIRQRLEDADSKKAEALTWLASSNGNNTLGEFLTTDESIGLIRNAYASGAEEVLAIEIDEYDDGHENTGKLLVKLPLEPAARRRVLQWCAEQAEGRGFEAEKDEGQTHAFVALD